MGLHSERMNRKKMKTLTEEESKVRKAKWGSKWLIDC